MTHFSAPLLAYQKALVENNRLSASAKLQHSSTKGRYLIAESTIKGGDVILTETAVLSADDQSGNLSKKRCLGCHQSPIPKNHQTTCVVFQSRYQTLSRSLKLIDDLCDQLNYPSNRSSQVVEYVVRINKLVSQSANHPVIRSIIADGLFPADALPSSTQSKPASTKASLASQFAEPVAAPSFSFAIDPSADQSSSSTVKQSVATSAASTPVDQAAKSPATPSTSDSTIPPLSLTDLALLTVSHLDSGTATFRQPHHQFADGFWRLLPQLLKRNPAINPAAAPAAGQSSSQFITPSTLTRLFTILQLNSHELFFDDSVTSQPATPASDNPAHQSHDGSFGDGLFPFLAMAEHSCVENCAFTQFIQPANQSFQPSPSQSAPPQPQVKLSVSQMMQQAAERKCREADQRHPIAQLRALHDIDESTPLSINYSPPYLPTRSRRAYLQDHYGFRCTCSMCSGEVRDKCRSLWCPKCEKSFNQSTSQCGIISPFGEGEGANEWTCEGASGETCDYVLPDSILRDIELVEDGLNELLTTLTRGNEEVDPSAEEETVNPYFNQDHAFSVGLSQALALCQLIVDRNELLTTESEPLDSSPPSSPKQSAAQSTPQSVSQSKTKQKNARRRTKARQALNQSRLQTLPLDVSLIDWLHPCHYLLHALIETVVKVLIGMKTDESSTKKALFDENFPLLLDICALHRSNTARVAGPSHWLNAVSASLTAEVYTANQQLDVACEWNQTCYDINMRVFGEHSTTTKSVQQRLELAKQQLKQPQTTESDESAK